MLKSLRISDNSSIIKSVRRFVVPIGEKIKALRFQKGWSQRDLARKLKCLQPHVARWETGKNVPSLDALKQLSNLFDVSLDALAFDKKDISELDVKDRSLISKLKDFDKLSEHDKQAIIGLIDSLTMKRVIQ